MLSMDKYELWQQARTANPHNENDQNVPFMAALEQFAAAVEAAERERIAKRCEEVAAHDLQLMSSRQVALHLASVCRTGAS